MDAIHYLAKMCSDVGSSTGLRSVKAKALYA